jgi:two-component system, chemotaxis family, chemotaxis protein CheY
MQKNPMTATNCVLVVDDDDGIREALCELLADAGHSAVSVANGKAALDYLRSTGVRPCVILLDLMMPVMDGETFRREQLADPALREIPVLLLTAAGRDAASRVPADGVLLKPVSLDDTLAAIARHCPAAEESSGQS